ncbi:MAG TPA: helix-turn-helix domain-containing protein [Solirubrobacter sp.]|nr:helix-turn-helix domain-containing protein [Solirubrobacter sp.]
MQDILHTVAVNLRALRAARGMSLGALAAASGTGKATLSRLEAREGNPTVETLYALADALGVPFGALVAAPTGRHLRADDVPHVGGAVEAGVLTRIAGAALVEALDVRFPAGHVRSSQPHPDGVVEHVLLTAGRLRAGPLDAPVELDAGDVLAFEADVPHAYAALGGDAQAIVLMAYPSEGSRSPADTSGG